MDGMTVRELSLAIGQKTKVVLKALASLTGRKLKDDDMVHPQEAEEVAIDFNVMPLREQNIAELRKVMPSLNAESLQSDVTISRPSTDSNPVSNLPRTSSSSVHSQSQLSREEYMKWPSRSPVVTIMGHVDHGKTSLLDALRNTNVVSTEAGGITQHIGAFTTDVGNGKRITFIDTPGHEAFSAMRAKGASCTDIVVLVVAADDGVMPQTVEALSHAKAAKVPIVVAVNKIDKPGADKNLPRLKQELMVHGLVPEEYGGDVSLVPVSALKRQGLPDLVDAVLLQADLLDLRAPTDGLGHGVVLEARLHKAWGPVATVLVRGGTLRVGDTLVMGKTYGRVRALRDCSAASLEMDACGPAVPCLVSGMKTVPEAGDLVTACTTEAEAKEIAEKMIMQAERSSYYTYSYSAASATGGNTDESGRKEVPCIVKADVSGSVEAVVGALVRLQHPEIALKIVHAGVGPVTPSDVALAEACSSSEVPPLIVAFNVRISARSPKVAIRPYRVIYHIVEDMRQHLVDLLDPRTEEHVLGRATVLDLFNVSKKRTATADPEKAQGRVVVIGLRVTDGAVYGRSRADVLYRVVRSGSVIGEGLHVSQLKRFQDDADKVTKGNECGLLLEGDGKVVEVLKGDEIVCYEMRNVKRSWEESEQVEKSDKDVKANSSTDKSDRTVKSDRASKSAKVSPAA